MQIRSTAKWRLWKHTQRRGATLTDTPPPWQRLPRPGGAAGTSEAELAALAHTAAAPLGETPAEFKPLAPGAKGA